MTVLLINVKTKIFSNFLALSENLNFIKNEDVLILKVSFPYLSFYNYQTSFEFYALIQLGKVTLKVDCSLEVKTGSKTTTLRLIRDKCSS